MKKLSLKRFLEINGFELNTENMRYENGYRYVDYALVKYAESKDQLFKLQETLWGMNEADRIKEMD